MSETEKIVKCAVVTGGSHNIGQGIAITLAKHGYDVAITYATRRDGASDTQKQIEAYGRRCFIYEAHLEKPEEPAALIRKAHRDLGRIDVMVCNAGRDSRNSVLTATAKDIDFLYQNDLRNYFLCVGAAARYMVKDDIKGSIIMITSVRATCPHHDDYIYGAMKAGMERACESMALELSAYNIRVNCVAPGAVWPVTSSWGSTANSTPFVRESIPLHRVGTPEDIGEAVAYLAGDESSYTTGITLRVDGGLKLPGMLERHEATQWKFDGWSEHNRDIALKILEDEENADNNN